MLALPRTAELAWQAPRDLGAGSRVTSRVVAAGQLPGATTASILTTLVALRQWRRRHLSRWHMWKGRVGRGGSIAMAAGSEVDLSMDIAFRPERKLVREFQRQEDVDDPVRPPALPRLKEGVWAPELPEPKRAPEVLVIGLGRQLRLSKAQGPRARLGAGAIEALQARYGVQTFFDADVRAYVGTCKASLDKTGRAGVQKIQLLQPVMERHNDVSHAISSALDKVAINCNYWEAAKHEEAQVLLVMSDWRLPFGQMRLRASFDDGDARLRSAIEALGKDRRIYCLHIGAGRAAASEPLADAELAALPGILANAATAIEVWLSEADVGLAMRFINRPQVYELPNLPLRLAVPEGSPPSIPPSLPPSQLTEDSPADEAVPPTATAPADEASPTDGAALQLEADPVDESSAVDKPAPEPSVPATPEASAESVTQTADAHLSEASTKTGRLAHRDAYSNPKWLPFPPETPASSDTAVTVTIAEAVLEAYSMGALMDASNRAHFALFDLERDDPTTPPLVVLERMSPKDALAVVQERPPNVEVIKIAGQRYESVKQLKREMVGLLFGTRPGQHLRLENDESAVRTLLAFHPDGDRLLEDTQAIKVDCSPVDDDVRCFWVLKFDGYAEDFSFRTCLEGLISWLELEYEQANTTLVGKRLGLGRWTQGLKETTLERAQVVELAAAEANK